MTKPTDRYARPSEVSQVRLAFGADLGDLLPPWHDIPDNFRRYHGDAESRPWRDLQEKWFFDGIDKSAVVPREDVDADKAWRHLAVIQRSYEPKHEHKEAAVAWLMSRWFKAVA